MSLLETEPFYQAPTSARQGEITSEEPNWLRLDWPNDTEAVIQGNEGVTERLDISQRLIPEKYLYNMKKKENPPHQYRKAHLLRIFLR